MGFFKSAWKVITAPFRWIFGGGAKKASEIAVKVVDLIKKYVESPTTAKFVEFIPGDIDDNLLAKLKKIVPDIAIKVAGTNTLLNTTGTPQQILAAYVNFLKTQAPALKAEQYNDLASEIIISLEDGKISFAEASIIAEETYQLLKAKGIIK